MVCVCSLLSLIVNRKLAGLLWRQMREHIKGLFLHKKEKNKRRRRRWVEAAVLGMLLALQIAGYFLYVPDTAGDIMTETIRTAELTDTIFCYDPLTGKGRQFKKRIHSVSCWLTVCIRFLNWRPCRFCTAGFIGCAVCLCRLFYMWQCRSFCCFCSLP